MIWWQNCFAKNIMAEDQRNAILCNSMMKSRHENCRERSIRRSLKFYCNTIDICLRISLLNVSNLIVSNESHYYGNKQMIIKLFILELIDSSFVSEFHK